MGGAADAGRKTVFSHHLVECFMSLRQGESGKITIGSAGKPMGLWVRSHRVDVRTR
jgi:hypothetical protein